LTDEFKKEVVEAERVHREEMLRQTPTPGEIIKSRI
jgi:hypothetical protein